MRDEVRIYLFSAQCHKIVITVSQIFLLPVQSIRNSFKVGKFMKKRLIVAIKVVLKHIY